MIHEDVVRFLKLFTELPLEEVEELVNLEGSGIDKAKIVLANEATVILHETGMPALLLSSVEKNLRPTIDYLHESLGGDETKLRQVVLIPPCWESSL